MIEKIVQLETILYSLDSLCGDASVHFKLNYLIPFTVLYNVIVCKTAIIQCKCNYKLNHTITQNDLIVHSIMQVIFNQ